MEAWLRVYDANVGHHRLSQHSSNVTGSQCSLKCRHIVELNHLCCHRRLHWWPNVSSTGSHAAIRPAAIEHIYQTAQRVAMCTCDLMLCE
jgi:hypothetical protein